MAGRLRAAVSAVARDEAAHRDVVQVSHPVLALQGVQVGRAQPRGEGARLPRLGLGLG